MPKPSGANPRNTDAPPETARSIHPQVRVPIVADAERLAEINRDTWRHAYAGIVPDAYLETLDLDRFRARWVERLTGAADDRVCFVAELDGLVAAYSVGGQYRVQHDAEPEDTTGWGEVYAIYTHPEMQGRGAGLALHGAVLDALREQGCSVAALWVLRHNTRSRRWYGDHGWRPDGATSMWLGAGEPLEEVRLTRSTSTARAVEGPSEEPD